MDAQSPSAPKPPTQPPSIGLIGRAIVRLVDLCSRSAWLVVALSLLVAAACGYYTATHFAINANTNDYLSTKLPWRQRLADLDKAFPQRNDDIVVVIDAATPELAESATSTLASKLETRPDLFQTVGRPDSGPYFEQNGLLFQPLAQVQRTVGGLLKAEPFLAQLVTDASLRGVANAFSYITRGVRSKAGSFDDFDRPMVQLSSALESVLAGHKTFFSWSVLFTGQKPDPHELRHFLTIKPVLNFAALQPGLVPSNFIRQSAKDLGLTPEKGVTVRLTGSVPLADEEYATVKEGSFLNSTIMALIVLFIIWSALKSVRIVLAVALGVIFGLAVTAALGLVMVKAFNLISVAFAVLFVGIGVDFGIQFSVRYRAERHDEPEFQKALRMAAMKAGRPLALAAAATTLGFYSFLPTDYRGVSELGLIAGTGMIIAFFTAVTLLPALLTLMRPPVEREAVGYKFLAPIDRFLSDHRHAVVIGTLGVALAGTPLLTHLHFDFNPLDLRSKKTEAVATLLDLQKGTDTETNTIDILAPNLNATAPVIAKLQPLPEVQRTITLDSFVPPDQNQKLPIIQHAAAALVPLFDQNRQLPAPSDAEDVAALNQAAGLFTTTAKGLTGKGADDARRLASLMSQLASAPPQTREAARALLLPGLHTMLDMLHHSLEAKPTGLDDIPESLRRDWISADGQALIEVTPKGDPSDNDVMVKFAKAVEKIAPDATGEPVAVQASGDTIVKAFIEAGIVALASISILLVFVLRRVTDMLLTLVPLLLAGLVTLEITVLMDMPLNFANIIALPLMLGLGVAFKIYFVMAWRAGTTNLLQSSLTRAVFYSAMTSATAFGSLWLSHHPGTSSMGKLLAISLVTTLCAAVLFQPALMGPPRQKRVKAPA
ncbi:MAG TPA: MMPL family transporter [Methylovirgula sp.]|nr:MMPL family transporter [Methylovirgula sp.]